MNCYNDNPRVSSEAFQELIRERTTERKQISTQECREDLKRIVERKSRDGISPLDIFPKEIWLNIINIGTPEDRGNICQVHPMFENLMNSNRIRDILFPQALPILLDKLKNNDKNPNFLGNKVDISKTALPPFMKLREVSKSLRSAADLWFEEKIDEEIQQTRYRPGDWSPVTVVKLKLDGERLNRLLEIYGDWKKFFVRSLEVDFSTTTYWEQDQENFQNDIYLPLKEKLMKLLELIGDQILCLKLTVGPVNYLRTTGVTLADYYLMVMECYQLTPNLRRLEVYFKLRSFGQRSDVSNKAPENLIETLESHTFPTLPKLRRLSLQQDYDIYITPKVHEAILKANLPHLRMLRLRMENEMIVELLSPDFQKTLDLKYFSLQNLSTTTPNFTNSLCKTWPLSILKIDAKNVALKEVFNSFNSFPTLEKISLFLTEVEIGSDLAFLMLPNLTHFRCEFHGKIDFDRDDVNFFFTLQFLLYAKKLRGVTWSHIWLSNSKQHEVLEDYLEEHESPEKMLDFRGGMRDLKTSNL